MPVQRIHCSDQMSSIWKNTSYLLKNLKYWNIINPKCDSGLITNPAKVVIVCPSISVGDRKGWCCRLLDHSAVQGWPSLWCAKSSCSWSALVYDCPMEQNDPSLIYFLDYWTQFDFTSHVNSQIQRATSIDQAWIVKRDYIDARKCFWGNCSCLRVDKIHYNRTHL